MDKKWEYDFIASSVSEAKDKFNAAGNDGWELFYIYVDTQYKTLTGVFKREKKSDLTPIRVPSSVLMGMIQDVNALIEEPNE